MSKLLIFVILFIIACHWSAGMSCRSCGTECVSACGTRRFRTCCFNYLRRKRGSDSMEAKIPHALDLQEDFEIHNMPYVVEDLDSWWKDVTRKSPKFETINED